jgi:hypothetical protein
MGAVAVELVVLSAWLIQAATVLRGGWLQVCGYMRDSVWGKPATHLNSLAVALMCAVSSTLAKLPSYIFVCTVLCKLILGVYYVGVW